MGKTIVPAGGRRIRSAWLMMRSRVIRIVWCGAVSVLTASAYAEEDLWSALINGKPDLYLRYRYEYVDDAKPGLDNAYASTLRTALGYNTGLFYGFGLYGQLEDVRTIGNDAYDDGGANGKITRAQVADPEGFDGIQQGNIRYEGIPQTVLRLGRQEITHRDLYQRFLSNVPWRQNWQSFEAFRALNQSLPNLTADYAYIWNANRIFSEQNSLPDKANYRLDAHAMRVEYTRWPFAKLEGYAYLLDFDDVSERFSTATYGMRVQGNHEIYPKLGLLYAGEVARQTDYRENPNDIHVNYYLGELGVSYALSHILDTVNVKVGYEVLEGDGGFESFQTPLATPHPFHGWSDRFTLTPADGLEDLYTQFSIAGFGGRVVFEYHDFSAENGDYDYGTEWDMFIEKTLVPNLMVVLKYSAYDADQNTTNVFRNSGAGAEAFDVEKAWAYVQYKY